MKLLFVVNAAPAVLAGGEISLASVRYRATMPAAALRDLGHDVTVVALDSVLAPDFRFAGDAIVLAQPKEDRVLREGLIPGLGSFIQVHRQAGIRLLIDVCDLKVGPHYAAHISGILRQPAQVEICRQFYPVLMRAADTLVVPTEILAQRLAEHIGSDLRFGVVGDPVEVARAPVRFAPQADAPLNLLWFGFFGGHARALAQFCQDDLPRLAALRPVSLTLLCEQNAVAHLDRLRGLAQGAVPIEWQPWSVPGLQQALAACDAVLLPIDHAADIAVGKSNNRALQALWAGRAVFAHPIASYRELDGFAIIGADLVAGLKAALDDPAACIARMRAGQAYVAETYTPEAIGRRWEKLLKAD
ncbi:hypothetical protein [Ferrovibrio sp.]|uniref:hypothetical protein n=1 Tax=Ferrovibrio sp. TaxID=1917215 RepID=UPI003D0C9BEE